MRDEWDQFPDAPTARGGTATADPWDAFPDASPQDSGPKPLMSNDPGRVDPQDQPLAPRQPKRWTSNRDIADSLAKSENPEDQALAAKIDVTDPGAGQWIDTSPADIKAEDHEERVRFYERSIPTGPVGRTVNSLVQGANAVSQIPLRPFLSEENADELARSRGLIEEAANRQAGDSFTERQFRGVAGSLGTMAAAVPAIIATGGKAAPLILAGTSGAATANEEYTAGKDAGLSKWKAAGYAAVQGTLEGGMSYFFTRVGMPGLEGAFSKPILQSLTGTTKKQLLGQLAGQVGKRLGLAGLQEIPEEAATQVAQNISTRMFGVDPNRPIASVSELTEVAVQSFLAAGLANTPATIMASTDAWVARNPDRARQIAAAIAEDGSVSRKVLEDAGVAESSKTNGKQRARLARKLAETLKRAFSPTPAAPGGPELRGVRPVGGEAPGVQVGQTVDIVQGGFRQNINPVPVESISPDGRTARVRGLDADVPIEELVPRGRPAPKPQADPNAPTAAYQRSEVTPTDLTQTQVLPVGTPPVTPGVPQDAASPQVAPEPQSADGATQDEIDALWRRANEQGPTFRLPNKVTKHSNVQPGDMVEYGGRPAIVKARSENGNKFDIYTDEAHYEGIDRRQLGGWQRMPKRQAAAEPLPDSEAGLPIALDEGWTRVSAGVVLPPGAQVYDGPTGRFARLPAAGADAARYVPPPNEQNPAFQPTLEVPNTNGAPLETTQSPTATEAPVPPAQQAAVGQPPAISQADLAEVFPGQVVTPIPNGYRVELANGQWFTVERTAAPETIDRAAAERTEGRKLTDEEFANWKVKASWQITASDGRKTTGLGLMKLVNGSASKKDVRHEALHAARSLGLLEPAEWKALVEKHAPNAKTDGEAEEAIAKKFAVWTGPTKLWQNIQRLINGFLSRLRVLNPSADTAFSRVESGEVYSRPGKAETPEQRSERLAGNVQYSGEVDPTKAWVDSLAKPALTEEGRDKIDEIRTKMGKPEAKNFTEMRAAARREFNADPAAAKAKVLEARKANGMLTDYETMLAMEVAASLADDGILRNSPELEELTRAYTNSRTETARSLRAGHDPLESPAKRRARLLSQIKYELPERVKDQIERHRKKGNNKLADAIEKKWKKRLEKTWQELQDLGIAPKTKEELEALLMDKERLMNVVRAALASNSSWNDVLFEWWNNAILSAPPTHGRNIFGNAAISAWRALEGAVKIYGPVALGQKSRADASDEAAAFISGFMPGFKMGVRNMKAAWRLEAPILDEMLGKTQTSSLNEIEGQYSIGSKWFGKNVKILGKTIDAGRTIRIPWRALRAMDEFFKAIAARTAVAGEAYRIAKSEGLSGEALAERIAELSADYQGEAWEAAYKSAKEATFQESGEEYPIRQKFKNALRSVRDVPGFKFLIPFVNTPVNIAAQVAERMPIIGTLPLLLRASENVRAGLPWSTGLSNQIARQTVGAALTAMIWSLTGDDDDEFQLIGKDKDNPYTVRIGDTHLSYAGIEPVASFVGSIVDAKDIAENARSTGGRLGGIYGSITDQIANRPMLEGIASIMALSGAATKQYGDTDETRGEKISQEAWKWAANFGASWLPNVVRHAARATKDEVPERRHWGSSDNEQWYQRLVDRTLQRTELGLVHQAAKYDAWGRARSQSTFGNALGDFAWRLLSPVKVSNYEPHPGDLFMAKWNRERPEGVKELSLPDLSPYYSVGSKRVPMSDEQFAEAAQLSGKIASALWESGKYDAEKPTAEQADALKDDFEAARTAARDHLKVKWAGGKVKPLDVTTLAKQLRAKQKKSIQERFESTVKQGADEPGPQFQARVADEKAKRAMLKERAKRWQG